MNSTQTPTVTQNIGWESLYHPIKKKETTVQVCTILIISFLYLWYKSVLDCDIM